MEQKTNNTEYNQNQLNFADNNQMPLLFSNCLHDY